MSCKCSWTARRATSSSSGRNWTTCNSAWITQASPVCRRMRQTATSQVGSPLGLTGHGCSRCFTLQRRHKPQCEILHWPLSLEKMSWSLFQNKQWWCFYGSLESCSLFTVFLIGCVCVVIRQKATEVFLFIISDCKTNVKVGKMCWVHNVHPLFTYWIPNLTFLLVFACCSLLFQ